MKVIICFFSVLFFLFVSSVSVFACDKHTPIDSVSIKGFEPTKKEIHAIEHNIPLFIGMTKLPGREPIKDVTRYRLQYQATLDHEGERVVYINAVCRSFWPNVKSWDTAMVMVKDGGSCFFQLNYNPKTDTFSNFMINGEA